MTRGSYPPTMGRMSKRVLRVLLASFLGAAASLVTATASASAADTYIVDPCDTGTFTVRVGDTVYFPNRTDAFCSFNVGNYAASDSFIAPTAYCYIYVFDEYTRAYRGDYGNPDLLITADDSRPATAWTADPGDYEACGWQLPPHPQASSAQSPIIVHQSVDRPADGSCEAVDDAGLAGGTGLTGGWSPSWELWPNGGSGGAVCTRTLVNDGTWHIS